MATKATTPTKSRRNRRTWQEIDQEILQSLDIAAEYRALGVEITGSKPNNAGWLACWAIDRPHGNNPSAAINVRSGFYCDLGGEGDRLGLWEFAARHGPYVDWKAARKHFALKVGIPLTRIGRPTRASLEAAHKQLEFRPWSDALVRWWCRSRPGVTPNAVRAWGGRIAVYGRFVVIAFPVFGLRLVDEDPVGWVASNITGAGLPQYDQRTKQIIGSLKIKTVAGSDAGLMNFSALGKMKIGVGTEPEQGKEGC